MPLTILRYVLWIFGPCLQMLLAAVIIRRKLHRDYPIFLTYTLSHVIRFVVLLSIYLQRNVVLYRHTYLGAEALDAALAFAVLYEVYGHIFRPWHGVQKAAGLLFRIAIVVLLALTVITTTKIGLAETSRIFAGLFTLERSVNIVRAGLLLLLFASSSYLGLRWERVPFGIAVGFAVESSVELATFALRSHWGLLGAPILSLISAAAYNCSVIIWLMCFALPEPVKPSSSLPAGSELENWNRTLLRLLHHPGLHGRSQT